MSAPQIHLDPELPDQADSRAGVYDPACERFDVAIKAIWLLYRWARWGLLAELGLARAEVQVAFGRFDYEQISSERGRLRTEEQCFGLIRYYPAVLLAAIELLKRYQAITSRSRGRYFQHALGSLGAEQQQQHKEETSA